MVRSKILSSLLAGSACALVLAGSALAQAKSFDIPGGDLKTALDAYARQSGAHLIYRLEDVRGLKTAGARGPLSPDAALDQLLAGAGLAVHRDPSGAVAIVKGDPRPQFLPASAPAQAAASTDDGANRLEEIIVTSSKRAERLQDVPVSVTAVTKDVLERGNVRELGDLVKLAPGLVISYGTQPGNFSINMRGIGTFSGGIAVESDVAVVIDDVPVGFQAAAFKDLIDIERVEVLRGPQSTLFGKSAIAGVLNIATQAPTSEFTGKATALVTNDSERRLGFTVSGPISDTLRFRLTAAQSDYEGNVTNLTTGKKVNGSRGFTLTGKLQWDPTENLQFSLAPRYNNTHATCCVSPLTSLTPNVFYQGLPNLPSSELLAGIPYNSKSNRYIRNNDRDGGDSETVGATVRANYTFDADSPLGAATLSWISAYDRYKMMDYQDTDGNDSPFLLYYPVATPTGIAGGAHGNGYFHTNSLTQELRLTSPSEGRLRYVAGLWYAKNDLDRFFDRGPGLIPARYLAESSNTNYAIYTQATYDLTDKTSLIGGARLNRQKIDYTFDKTIFTGINPTGRQVFGKADQDDAVTGKIGVQHKWTPEIMTFATYSTGYKGQAYDLVSAFDARTASQMPVPAETAKNYEIGMKSTLFDRRVYLNVTAFDADFYGFQTTITATLPDGTFLTALNSVGHLRTRGVEVDALARIGPHLRLNAAGAYTDATVVSFPNGPCYNNQPLTPGGCHLDNTNSRVQDLAGQRLNNTPEWKFNVGGQYDVPLDTLPFDGFVAFAYRWQSKINFALSQDPTQVQKAYGIFDLSAGVTDHDGKYKFSVFANNLFNKHYAQGLGNGTAGFSAPGVTVVGTNWFPGRDSFRYAGARLDVNF
ncbi:MAG: TonB-dependent receptor [Caulobacter sp.]|nr:TonB-dependent receptor [Caulobacter sp.]